MNGLTEGARDLVAKLARVDRFARMGSIGRYKRPPSRWRALARASLYLLAFLAGAAVALSYGLATGLIMVK